MDRSGKERDRCACEGRSWLRPCALLPLATQKTHGRCPLPHSPGLVPDTRTLVTLLLFADCSLLPGVPGMPGPALQSHMSCAGEGPGTAGAALGTVGWGTHGQGSPPGMQRSWKPGSSGLPLLPGVQVPGQTVSQVGVSAQRTLGWEKQTPQATALPGC